MKSKNKTILLAALFLCSFTYSNAYAAEILVDTEEDILENCSFRKAVSSINFGVLIEGCTSTGGSLGLQDTIKFEKGITSIDLSNELPRSLILGQDMIINPRGPRIILDGGGALRSVLIIQFGATVSLNNIVVTGGIGGTAFESRAGGITVRDSHITLINSSVKSNSNSGGGGAGITAINSDVTIIESGVSNNSSGIGGIGGISAGLSSRVRLVNSSVSDNVGGLGGGVFTSNSYLEVVNSTISSNRLLGETGATFSGVGINSGRALLINSTIANNFAPIVPTSQFNTVAAVLSIDAEIVLKNSIIANSAGHADCATSSSVFETATVIFSGSNLVEDGSCGTKNLSNVLKGDPRLGKLTNNPHSTSTHSLLRDSIAIDSGDYIVCNSAPVNGLDQLGRHRSKGGGCDLGSREHFANLSALSNLFLLLDE